MAKKKTLSDDEIIDLTELIESGESKPKKAAAAYSRAAAPAENDDPLDFDSVLSSAAQNGKAAQSRPVDPHEELDMSDLGEIDNILESLNMPPQPEPAASAPPPPPPQAEPEDDLDSVLDDLLGASPQAAKTQEKREAQPEEREPSPDLDSNLDADLDNILSSIDEPPMARPKPAAKADTGADQSIDDLLGGAAPEAPDFELPKDLDSLLDDPEPPKAPQDPPKRAAVIAENSAAEGPSPAPESPQPSAPSGAGLSKEALADIIQGVMSSQGASQEALQNVFRQLGGQSAHLEDLAKTVDDISKRLLAAESALTNVQSQIAGLKEALSSQASFEDLFREGSPLHAGFMKMIAASAASAVKGVADKISAAPGAAEADPRLDAGAEALDRLESFERRVNSLEQALSARIDDAGAAISALQASADSAGAEDEKLEKLESRLDLLEPSFSARLDQADAAIAALQASAGSAGAEDEKLEKLESRLDLLEPSLSARLDQADAAIAALQASADSAGAEDEKLEKLEERLDALEAAISARLNEAQEALEAARGALLEKQAAPASGELENLLALMTPDLGEKLEQVFKSSAENGKKLEKLIKTDRGVQARLDSFETRLDQLEPNFNIQVEKAAASAVVRILNEEIGRLAEGN